MNTNDEDTIRRYVESVVIPLVNTDNEKYPIRAGRVAHLFLPEYVREFIEDMRELKSRGFTCTDIGRCFGNPTRIMRMSHHIIMGARQAGLSIVEQKNLVLELMAVVKTMKAGNPFNEDKKNVILTEAEIKKMLAEKGYFAKSDRETSRLIHRLCGVMWSYSETPYFVAHDISMEEHGPYETKEGRVVVRDFFNLKPMELWPECGEFPFDKMRVICVYDKNYDMAFDVYGNNYHKEGDPVSSLLYYRIEADDRLVDVNDLKGVFDAALTIIRSITGRVSSLNEKQLAKKYADIFWYRKKPLRDAISRDWRPQEKVYESIEAGEVKPEIKESPTADDIRKKIGLLS